MTASSAGFPVSSDGAAGERRQLTVLFCDLVDSTGLSERRDPEDLRDFLIKFQKLCTQAVEGCGGRVVNYIGDGIRAQFGYPTTSENEAESAVRAALAIRRGMAALNEADAARIGEAVHQRIGIHTGWAVIGSGDTVHGATEIVGDTPNIAARLQEGGEPGAIVISDETRRLLRGKFLLRPLGTRQLKGLKRQLGCFQLLDEAGEDIVDRLLHLAHSGPMIGRTGELARLAAAWEHARSGAGQAVEVSGEPGIGKSRLIAEFSRKAGVPRGALHALQASPDHQNVPLYPVVRHVAQQAGLRRDADAGENVARLRAYLAQAGKTGADTEWLLGRLLDVPVIPPPGLGDLDPPEIRRRTRDMLASLLSAPDGADPVLLLVEDLHWCDPSTRELVDRLAAQAGSLPLLLLVTTRMEGMLAEPQPDGPVRLPLLRLEPAACIRLASTVIRAGALAPALVDSIVARSDGVPLFVEELVAAAVETGRLQAVEALSVTPESSPVPSALYDPLMIRLERLGDAKAIAQVAAVIGRTFSHDLLAALAGTDVERVDDALEKLGEAGLVRTEGASQVYSFKHALVRDVAYHSLLKRQRRELHARVAEIIPRDFPEFAEAEPDYLARHLAEAGQPRRAAELWLRAAGRASERSANLEAIAQLGAALAELEKLPPGPEREGLELDVQIALIAPTIALRGYSAAEVAAVSRRALDLCLARRADRRALPALYARWSYDRCTGNLRAARRLAETFLASAEEVEDRTGRAVGHRLLATSLLLTRRFADARDHFERAIALCDLTAERADAIVYSIDVRSTSHALLAILAWHMGDPAGGTVHAQRGMQLASDLRHANTLGYAVAHVCMFHTFDRNVAMVEALANRVFQAAAERELPFWMTIARTFLGWCEIQSGRPADGIVTLDRERAFLERVNLVSWMPVYLCWLTEAHLELGQFDHAGRCLAQARKMIGDGGESWYEPECWRLQGRLALRAPDAAAARACFERALALSREAQDTGFGLRASIDLADLLARDGERDGARTLLAEALAPYAGQPAAGDRAAARALLSALA